MRIEIRTVLSLFSNLVEYRTHKFINSCQSLLLFQCKQVVQLLLTLGVDPRATDSSGRMASHAAAQSPNHAVLGLLLREGVCPLTAKDKNKQTVLIVGLLSP